MISRAGSYKLFTAFGIDVYVHWTWFVAAWLLYSYSGYVQQPYGLAQFLAVYLALFGIVLLHEFGHALACRSVGGRANLIVLWPLGGVAYVAPPPRPGATLWSIAAGPLVNVVLVPVLLVLQVAAARLGSSPAAVATQSLLGQISGINLILLVFNLLPIYPLDGGQIVQSVLWFFIGRARSLRAVAVVGLTAAGAGLLWALWRGELFLVLICLFVAWQAWQGTLVARVLAQQEANQTQSIDRALERARQMTTPQSDAR